MHHVYKLTALNPFFAYNLHYLYGIPWELCEEARLLSETQVSLGFAPSWPDLACANVTYFGPERMYSQTLPLTEGKHTLWTGTVVKSSLPLPWMRSGEFAGVWW